VLYVTSRERYAPLFIFPLPRAFNQTATDAYKFHSVWEPLSTTPLCPVCGRWWRRGSVIP